MTRLDLEKQLDVDRSQISRIERGQMLLVSTNVQKICTYLRVRLESYIGQPTNDRSPLQRRILRINALLGGTERGDAAVSQLLNALEAFAETYSSKPR